MEREKIRLTPQQAKPKIEYFCNYQERCQSEVKDKLYTYGLNTDEVNELLAHVVKTGLVNEERFARLFCGGKFRQKQWGREKIKRELRYKQIGEPNIKRGLTEIDDEAYMATLEKLAEKYYQRLKDRLNYIKVRKTIQHLTGKGYEFDLINDVMKRYNSK